MKYRLHGKKDIGWYIPEYVAYVTLMTSFVFNIISMIMGSYILWTGSNPFGIILFFWYCGFLRKLLDIETVLEDDSATLWW